MLVLIFVLPIVFAVAAAYVIVRLALAFVQLLLALAFALASLRRERVVLKH